MNRNMILEQLEKRFKEGSHEQARLIRRADGAPEEKVLITLHEGFGKPAGQAEGLFYFETAGELTLFVCRIILAEALSPEALVPAGLKAALANTALSFGGFLTDPVSGNLEYRFSEPLPEGLAEEELLETADACIALGLSLAERFAGELQEAAGV